jgi:phosphonoacetaldehyde hydrolase
VKLRAVILDWAGTVVDYGSRAPIAALQSVFTPAAVPITIAEARASMGVAKKAHIRSILEIPRVRAAWIAQHGAEPSEADVDKLYAEFIPNQIRVLANYSKLIPGVADAVARMRSRGLKIGTTTGYNRAMLDCVLERAAAQDFTPDCALCPEDVGAGRPLPWMCYLTAIHLEVYPMSAFVKIGDTPADIEEGRNAGMWTIGITRTGNEIGVTEEEWSELSTAERAALLHNAEQRLLDAGAHYTAPSVAECDPILDQIEARLALAERP